MTAIFDPRPDRRLPRDLDLVRFVRGLSPAKRRRFVAALGPEDAAALNRAWREWAHRGQVAPDGDWSVWVLKAGRGFGKTLAGAQWLVERIAAGGPIHIALVGASLEDARRVMVEGRSGLLDVAAPWVDRWEPSLRRLTFTTGAEATIFSGASPDILRGPEHHLAWCDELAKWERAQDSWDMLQFGLRLGDRPQALVTTTPGRAALLGALIDAPGTVMTEGRTRDNPHLSAGWRARIVAQYAGTRLGRQELDGEILPGAGALWTPEVIEACRVARPLQAALGEGGEGTLRPIAPVPPDPSSRAGGSPEPRKASVDAAGLPPAREHGRSAHTPDLRPRNGVKRTSGPIFARTLVAVDPPAKDGTCGIVAVARDGEGVVHILADHSVTGRSPDGWARAVADACALHGTDEVVVETNQGGRMVKTILLAADPRLRIRPVTAVLGKTVRAEPVAQAFEAGRVRLHGRMPELEAQLLGLIAGGGYEGPGGSPDRADAMVWGVTEAMRAVGARVRGM